MHPHRHQRLGVILALAIVLGAGCLVTDLPRHLLYEPYTATNVGGGPEPGGWSEESYTLTFHKRVRLMPGPATIDVPISKERFDTLEKSCLGSSISCGIPSIYEIVLSKRAVRDGMEEAGCSDDEIAAVLAEIDAEEPVAE